MPNPSVGYFSIERLFDAVIRALPPDIRSRRSSASFHSRGLLSRLYTMIEAWARRGEVNHVTGDVHFLAMLLRKSRTLVTVHDLETVHRSKGVVRLMKLWLFYKLPLWRCAEISTVSPTSAEDLARMTGIARERIRVIPNCISGDFQPVHRNFNPEEPSILFIGTKPNKNLERSIAALAKIRCRLRIIGELTDRQRSLLDQSGIRYSVAHSLTDEQILREYVESDILLFPSLIEGFGMPILEAQATGRIVVTSDRPPMRDVAGGAAVLVDPERTASIKDGVARVTRDPTLRADLVTRGFENCRHYSAESVASMYADLYRQIARENGRPPGSCG